MTRTWSVFGVVALLGFVVGCGGGTADLPVAGGSSLEATPHTAPAATAPQPTAADLDPQFVASSGPGARESKHAAIGQLKSRQHIIVIHAGSDGPRFTVTKLDGEVIARELSTDEMRAEHPSIYEMYKSTFALQSGYLDASISPALTK